MSATLEEQILASKEESLRVSFPDIRRLRFEGKDSKEFLQRMLTSDLTQIKPGQPQESLFLQPGGKIQAYFWLHEVSGGWEAVGHQGHLSTLAAELDRYRFSEDVSWKVLPGTPDMHLGPRTAEWNLKPPEGYPLRWAGRDGFFLFSPTDDASSPTHSLAGSWEGIEVIRVEAGQPAPGREITGDVFPQEVGLDQAFHLAKGCFPGQEAVAKMTNLGKPRYQLRGFRFEQPGSWNPGDRVWEGDQDCGWITSTAISPTHGPIGLGFLRLALATSGKEFLGKADRRLKTTSLPFS